MTAPDAILKGPDGSWYSARLQSSSQDVLTDIQRYTDMGQSWETIAEFCSYAIPGTITPDGRYLYLYYSAGFLGRIDLGTSTSTDETPRSAIEQAKVFPNPTSGLLMVDLPEEAGITQAILYDLNGRQVQLRIENTARLTMDLSALNHGVYLLKVRGDGWLQSARVIVIEE